MADHETALPRPIDADRLEASVTARATARAKVTAMATVVIDPLRFVLKRKQQAVGRWQRAARQLKLSAEQRLAQRLDSLLSGA